MAEEETIPQEIEQQDAEGQPEALTESEEILADGDDPEDVDVGTENSGIRAFAERILTRIPRPEAVKVPKILGPSGKSDKEKKPKKRAVKLQTLTYDEDAEEYTLAETETYFEDLPPGAVHVTGKKNRYFLDLVEDPDESDPQGIRATDLYLWMVNNSINDALAVKSKGIGDVDIRRYIVLGIGLIIGVCVIYAMI